MRKLLLGLGLLMVERYVTRRSPTGWRRFLSLRAFAAAVVAGAASELLARPHKASHHAPPPQGI